jgi:hypothetical protein
MDPMIQKYSRNISDMATNSALEILASSSMQRMEWLSSISEKISNLGISINQMEKLSPRKNTAKKIQKVPLVQMFHISRASSILLEISDRKDTESESLEREQLSSRHRWILRMKESSNISSMA